MGRLLCGRMESLARARDGALADLDLATAGDVLELNHADGAVHVNLGEAEVAHEGAAVTS